MFIKKHHYFKYIISRLRQIYYYRNNKEVPWMTRDSIILLDNLIRKSDVGLEYGSGGSTYWFACKCNHLTSIEHKNDWYNIVNKKINNLRNIDSRLLSLDKNPHSSDYYKSILKFADESLVFLINDGKYRDLITAEGL